MIYHSYKRRWYQLTRDSAPEVLTNFSYDASKIIAVHDIWQAKFWNACLLKNFSVSAITSKSTDQVNISKDYTILLLFQVAWRNRKQLLWSCVSYIIIGTEILFLTKWVCCIYIINLIPCRSFQLKTNSVSTFSWNAWSK